ncbi:MAG: TlpA family protein disulfide reductase, partial [Bacteriovoracaceae bacterium]
EKAPIKIVNFWASWCKPCIEEFKSLNELKEKFGDKVQILGVNTDDEDQKKKIQKLSKKYDFKFQVVPDKNSELVTKFDVKNIPFSVIYINGKVHQFHEGAMDFMAEEFLEDVQKKLK